MTMILKDLCRLCATKDDFSKDLLDESNKNVLKMIQEFVQITIQENENMPTKICISCEDKMLSFHMFVLECYKVQESLRKMYVESANNFPIKLEEAIVDFEDPSIKSEVKDELTAEDIVCAINNEATLSEFNRDDFQNDDHPYEEEEEEEEEDDDDDNDDEYGDVSLAQLKEAKKKHVKRKVLTEEETERLKKVLKETDFKVKDFVKLKCNICEEGVKSWSGLRVHYAKLHKTKPVVYCICGFLIRSKSVLYKHVSDHKVESRKFRKEEENTESKQQDSKYSNLHVKDFVNFTCTVCHKQCSSWYTLRTHCEKAHKIRPIVHCICGITLKSKSVLYKHVQDHKNPDILACDKCPRITKTLAALNKHKMRHIPKAERKFCCSSCDKIFHTKDTLKSHERSHIPIEERKIYHCGICDLKFTTRSSAASHKRVVHDKIKSYVCDLCGYACGTNGELRQHRAIHSDDKPFVCRTCAKPFKTYSNLKTHMDTHEDTSYACYVCSRVLNSRRTLRKHLLVHEDKCRHVCHYCNKAFKRRQTLKVHMYTHTGDKPLTCKWCEERFAYASTLRSHRLRCHPDKMAAPQHHVYAYGALDQHDEHDQNDPHDQHDQHDQHDHHDHHDPHDPHNSHLAMHQDYNMKSDIVSVTKNEAEAIIDKV